MRHKSPNLLLHLCLVREMEQKLLLIGKWTCSLWERGQRGRPVGHPGRASREAERGRQTRDDACV